MIQVRQSGNRSSRYLELALLIFAACLPKAKLSERPTSEQVVSTGTGTSRQSWCDLKTCVFKCERLQLLSAHSARWRYVQARVCARARERISSSLQVPMSALQGEEAPAAQVHIAGGHGRKRA